MEAVELQSLPGSGGKGETQRRGGGGEGVMDAEAVSELEAAACAKSAEVLLPHGS